MTSASNSKTSESMCTLSDARCLQLGLMFSHRFSRVACQIIRTGALARCVPALPARQEHYCHAKR
jgi:hypothetical protein